MATKNHKKIKVLFAVFVGLLSSFILSTVQHSPSYAATAAYSRVNNQTIKFYYAQDTVNEHVSNLVYYYHADKPQALFGYEGDQNTYFWRIKQSDNDPSTCEEYIVKLGAYTPSVNGTQSPTGVKKYTEKRINGACEASPEISDISANYINDQVGGQIFFYKTATGDISPADNTAGNSVFKRVKNTTGLNISGGQDVYVQDQPASKCPSLLISYASDRWGFVSPVATDIAQTDSAHNYYLNILRGYGYDISQTGGCKIVDSNDVRVNNEKTLSSLLGGDPSYWKSSDAYTDYSKYGDYNSLLQVVKRIGNPVGDLSAAEIRLGTAPAGSVGSGLGTDQNPGGSTTTKSTCVIDGVGWIICPVVNLLAKVSDGAFGFLSNSFLKTNTAIVDTASPTYTAWSAMRSLANIAFVIAFLFIIFSQLTSVGISNYGVKKMLPRLVIAAILVNISYFVCQIAVDLSNILGFSLKGLFDNIINASIPHDASQAATGQGFAGVAGSILAFGGAVAIVYALLATLIPIVLAAVVALVMILFILIARQALIILLIVVSPLAFVAFLLPNTESWFKKWQKTFTAMLMLFPIIAVVFGASSLASNILSGTFNAGFTGDQASEAQTLFGQLIASLVLVLPLFVVPGLLKKSLDSVGTLGAKINGVGNKLGGALGKKGSQGYENSRLGQFKKYRGQKSALNRTKIQAGVYSGRGGKFNPNNWRSSLNSKFNDSKLSGEFGDRSADTGIALINKEEKEGIDNAVQRIKATHKLATLGAPEREGVDYTPGGAEQELVAAYQRGDITTMRAAASILTSSGPIGIEKLHRTAEGLSRTANPQLYQALQGDVNASGVKGRDAALATWAYTQDGDLSAISSSGSAYSGLTIEDAATQTAQSLRRAAAAGGISTEIATGVLSNPNTNRQLNTETRAIFESIAGVSPSAPTTPTAEDSGYVDLRAQRPTESDFERAEAEELERRRNIPPQP